MTNCCNDNNLRQNCNFFDSTSNACNTYVDQVMNVIYGGQLNWYNIYGDCLTTTTERFNHKKYERSINLLHRKYKEKKKKNLNLKFLKI